MQKKLFLYLFPNLTDRLFRAIIFATVEPPVSDHPKCQVEVVAYESLDHNA